MNIDRRTFLKGTGIGVASLATGMLPAMAIGRQVPLADSVDQPMPAAQVAYWHEHMIAFMEEHGDPRYLHKMPEEPDWRIREKGLLKWTTVMPYPIVYHRDVRHLDETLAMCAYAYGVVDTAFGRLRADHFFKDTFHTSKPVHIDSGSLVLISLNGQHLGYSGYTIVPQKTSLNFEGVRLGEKILKVWSMPRNDFAKRDSPYYLWERV